MIERRTSSRSSRGRCAERELHLDLLAQTESIFALSNGHIGLRGNLDEGEPHGTPGTYLNGVLRDAAAAVRRGRLRLSRGRPDADQRHQRQGHPPAGRRRAVRHALRRRCSATSACSTCATACCRARSSGSRPPGQAVRVRSTRLVSFVQRAVAAIRYEVEPVDAAARIVVQSELVANEPVPAARPTTRARPPRCARPLGPEHHGHHELRGRARAPHARERPADGGRDGPRRRRARAGRVTEAESEPDLARVTVSTELEPGPEAADRQVPRVRVVEPALDCRRCATRSTPRSPPPSATGWDGAARRPARVPRRLLGPRRRRDRRRPRAAAGGALRALPGAAGRRARRAARDPGQGADRPRLRRPHVLGHGDLHAAGADLHRARRRARRAALAPLDARPRRGARPASCGSRARRSRGGRSAARSARATGRRARRRSTSTPTSPTRSRRYVGATGDEAFERGPGARAARRDRAAVALGRPPRRARRLPDRRRDRARRVHARSPTTTSSRTSWRRATCAPPPTLATPPSAARRASSASTRRRSRAGATPPTRWSSPTTTSSASRRSRRRSPATATGTSSARPRRAVPAAAALPLLPAVLEPGRQAGRPRVRAVRCAATTSTPSRRRATSSTTSASPSATRRCRRASRRSSRPRSATSTSPTTTSRETAFIDLRDLALQHRATACTSRRSPGSWLVAVAGFGGMRDHGEPLAFAPRLPARADAARASG